MAGEARRNPRFLERVGQREDDRSNIIVEVMARLHADGFHRLRLYVETRDTNPSLKFRTWIRVVTKRVAFGCSNMRRGSAHSNTICTFRSSHGKNPGSRSRPARRTSMSISSIGITRETKPTLLADPNGRSESASCCCRPRRRL